VFDSRGVLLAIFVPALYFYTMLEGIRDCDAPADGLGRAIGRPSDETKQRLARQARSFLPVLLKTGLTLREAALIEGHRLDLPGLRIQAESQRSYVNGPLAGHLLGYVGEVSAEQQDEPAFAGLVQGSFVGKTGVEKTF